MKTCLYCAEQVQDEAIVCRYCQKPLPTKMDRLDERHARFAVGSNAGGFGLWDLSRGGPPIEAVPVSDWEDQEGIGRAWRDATALLRRYESGEERRERQRGSARPIMAAVLTALGGVLCVLGSFLPWISAKGPFIGTISTNGLEGGGDGVMTLLAGVALIVVGLAKLAPTPAALLPIFGVLAALVAGSVVLYDFSGVIQPRLDTIARKGMGFVTGSMGAGIWTIGVGAVAGFVGCLIPGRSKR